MRKAVDEQKFFSSLDIDTTRWLKSHIIDGEDWTASEAIDLKLILD